MLVKGATVGQVVKWVVNDLGLVVLDNILTLNVIDDLDSVNDLDLLFQTKKAKIEAITGSSLRSLVCVPAVNRVSGNVGAILCLVNKKHQDK